MLARPTRVLLRIRPAFLNSKVIFAGRVKVSRAEPPQEPKIIGQKAPNRPIHYNTRLDDRKAIRIVGLTYQAILNTSSNARCNPRFSSASNRGLFS